MAHLKEIVDRINTISATRQMTNTVKMVSMTKLYKAQQQLSLFKAYKEQCHDMFMSLLKCDGIKHALLEHGHQVLRKTLLIVIASDRGMCGSFNKNVFSTAGQYIKDIIQDEPTATIDVLTVGRKAMQFSKKYNVTSINQYVNLINEPDRSRTLTTYCMEAFQRHVYSDIVACYTSFKHATKQQAVITSLLPIVKSMDNEACHNMAYAIHEPSVQILFEKLVQIELDNQIKSMLLESITSEHTIRVMNMGKASDNANELLQQLHLTYNRTRQALITNALAEITSGAEALKG